MNQNSLFHAGARLRLSMAAVLVLSVGCASTPPKAPDSLQAAQQAITSAEGIDAGHSAPGELSEARSKLVDANLAVKDGHVVRADQLALQSRAAADLAVAKTTSLKARAVNTEMKSGNAALVEELNRKAGDSK